MPRVGCPRVTHPFAAFPSARRLWFSLDLHVLSAPPAFVLSQDQTLREEVVCRAQLQATLPAGLFTLSSCSKATGLREEHAPPETRRRGVDVPRTGRSRPRFSTLEERSLLSFQRPVPPRGDAKKPPTRARGLRGIESYRIRVGPWEAPRVEVRETSCAVLSDSRRSIAPPPRVSNGRNAASRPAAAPLRARPAARPGRRRAHR